MRKQLSVFVLAALAGMAIAIGGAVYLSMESKLAGALLFSVGLYTICVHGLNLFTGKVGYAPLQPPAYWGTLGIIWLGNWAGTWLAAEAMRLTRVGAGLAEKAAALCETKLADSPLSLFLLGIFCGILMYAAVEGYKRTTNPLILFAGVSVFILCGFEHCIADMYYFSMAGLWSGRALLYTLAITAGNALGGMLIPLGGMVSKENTSK